MVIPAPAGIQGGSSTKLKHYPPLLITPIKAADFFEYAVFKPQQLHKLM
jgi:hypothetical protein